MRNYWVFGLLLVACTHAPPAPPEPPARPRGSSPDEWPLMAARVLEREKPNLRDCYEREVRRVEDAAVAGAYRDGQKVPPLAGKLVLVLPVEPDGSIAKPRVDEDSLKNGDVSRCLVEKAKALHLAPPPEGEPVELTVPFTFQLLGPGD